MRSFIYGRYNVLQGLRGYEVFGHDHALSRETVKEISSAFSSKDPHFKILRALGEFFVYFPIMGDEWVFGKGNVEERGEYFSYILHGVVLSAHERADLWDNPFLLADRLDPMIEDRRELPPTPRSLRWDEARYLSFVVSSLQAIAQSPQGRVWVFVLGDLVTRLLEQDLDSGGIVYPYDKQMGARIWSLVWFLTPKQVRDRLTLSSLAPFLNRDVSLSGVFSGFESLPRTRFLDPAKPRRTDFGSFLFNLSGLPAPQAEERLRIFTAAFDDLAASRGTGPANANDENLKRLLRAVDKPSVHALRMWMEIPTSHRLFPWKIRYYQQIWRGNREEIHDYFPDLEQQMLADTLKTWRAAAEGLSREDANRVRALRDQVLTTLEAHLKPALVLVLLETLDPDDPYLVAAPDPVLTRALWSEHAQPSSFDTAFRHLLQYRAGLDPEWELLAGHPHFLTLSPELHARFFDGIQASGRPTRHGIDQLIEMKYLAEPKTFRVFLLGFKERTAMISRIVKALRKGAVLAAADPDESGRWLKLIGICREVDPDLTERLTASWINHRDAEFLIPAIVRDRDLVHFFIRAWSDGVRDELGKLRFCYLVREKCQNLVLEPGIREKVDLLARENRSFDMLLGMK